MPRIKPLRKTKPLRPKNPNCSSAPCLNAKTFNPCGAGEGG